MTYTNKTRYTVRNADGKFKTLGELIRATLTMQEYGKFLAAQGAK